VANEIAAAVPAAAEIKLRTQGAKLALSKSANKAVRDFAEGLVRDNTAVSKQTADVVVKLRLAPEDNDLSRALTEHAAYKRAELAKLKGAEFDKACIANEAAYQMTVSGALAVTLVPSAANPELKNLLQSGLRNFEGRQQPAKELASGTEVKADLDIFGYGGNGGGENESHSATDSSALPVLRFNFRFCGRFRTISTSSSARALTWKSPDTRVEIDYASKLIPEVFLK
jgi:putative membrane protein